MAAVIDTDRVNQLIDYIADGIESGGDFAMQQAPLIAQDIVVYGRVTGGVVFVGAVLVAATLAWLARKMWRLSQDTDDAETSMLGIFGTVVFAVCCAIAVGVAATEHNLMAWVAPRLYVLNYLRDMIGG